MVISTHTLTWSVTECAALYAWRKHISTHTLTWSVTKCIACSDSADTNFNSHAHVERDIIKIH